MSATSDTARPADASRSPHTLSLLHGPARSAVRRPDRNRWILASRSRVESPVLPLGLLLELSRSDIGRRETQGASPARTPGTAPELPLFPLPPGLALAGAALLTAAGLAGILLGPGTIRPFFAGAPGGFTELASMAGVVALVLPGLRWIEAAVLSSCVEGDASLLRLHRGLRLETVAWRLGPPATVSWAVVLLPVGLAVAAVGWWSAAPVLAAGVAAGAVLWLIPALFPLTPGPGTRILEMATGIDDLPIRMRWSLLQRFLPVPNRFGDEGSRAVAAAALALAAWAAAAGAGLHGLGAAPDEGVSFAGVVWQVAATAGLAGYALWLLFRTGGLLVDAGRLTGLISLEPLAPDEALTTRWRKDNPLVRRLPELRDADWRWGLAPQGTLLTRHGSERRSFYWLARGRAQVVGRDEHGDPLPFATVGGGAGIGEIGLLEGRPRTADVVAEEDCVVAILEPEAYRRVARPETTERFRELVRASQALAASDVFWGLGPDERSRWLAHGSADRFPKGAVVVRTGEPGRWVGLVVDGGLEVERDGSVVAELGTGDVFGEIAYLTDGLRTATLRATEDTRVWRWEAEWLREALGRAGLVDVLRTLAGERSSESR